MADACKTCKFWKKLPGVAMGNCRVKAPQIVRVSAYGASKISTQFPQVENNEWCGEWVTIPALMLAPKES